MAIKMVREPSETPNINNTDDFIPIRYGYGNQNGYIKNKGTEIDYTIDGNNFTITSGRIVLQGVECDIDANGYTITTNQSISSPLYYTVYYEVDLENNQVSIKSENDPLNYPVISDGDDLTHIINGVARLVLYKFISTAGVINNVEKVIKEIGYVEDNLNKKFNTPNATNFGDYIVPKQKLVWEGELSIGSTSSVRVTNFTPKRKTMYKFIIGTELESFIWEYYIDELEYYDEMENGGNNGTSRILNLYYQNNRIQIDEIAVKVTKEFGPTLPNYYLNFQHCLQIKTFINEAPYNITAGYLKLYKIYEIIE